MMSEMTSWVCGGVSNADASELSPAVPYYCHQPPSCACVLPLGSDVTPQIAKMSKILIFLSTHGFFIACQHTDARYLYSKSVRPSVRLSVRDVPVSYENGLTYRHSFSTVR